MPCLLNNMLSPGIKGFFMTIYPRFTTIYPKFRFVLDYVLYCDHQQENTKLNPKFKKGWMMKWKTN